MSKRVKPKRLPQRELEEIRERDPDGRIVFHHRTVDTLGKMLRAGTIDESMHDAAKDFQAAFIVANLDPLRALPILRVPGTGREPELNGRQLDARRRVHKARCRRWGASRARRGHASGMWSACSGACGSGRYARDGVDGPYGQSRLKVS